MQRPGLSSIPESDSNKDLLARKRDSNDTQSNVSKKQNTGRGAGGKSRSSKKRVTKTRKSTKRRRITSRK